LATAICTEAYGTDAMCVPFFDEGDAPPGYETLGLCKVPG
jgi:hypothetical protein